jgi:hypothetical protein
MGALGVCICTFIAALVAVNVFLLIWREVPGSAVTPDRWKEGSLSRSRHTGGVAEKSIDLSGTSMSLSTKSQKSENLKLGGVLAAALDHIPFCIDRCKYRTGNEWCKTESWQLQATPAPLCAAWSTNAAEDIYVDPKSQRNADANTKTIALLAHGAVAAGNEACLSATAPPPMMWPDEFEFLTKYTYTHTHIRTHTHTHTYTHTHAYTHN